MTRTAWRAVDPSGLAHAFVGSGAHALCGVRNQPERHDWPTRVKCALCFVREEARKQEVTSK